MHPIFKSLLFSFFVMASLRAEMPKEPKLPEPMGLHQNLPDEFEKLNHCNKDSDCAATRMYFSKGILCPTKCGSMGILIHKKEEKTLKKLGEKFSKHQRNCPIADCAMDSNPDPKSCPLQCLKSKCQIDLSKAARGC